MPFALPSWLDNGIALVMPLSLTGSLESDEVPVRETASVAPSLPHPLIRERRRGYQACRAQVGMTGGEVHFKLQ